MVQARWGWTTAGMPTRLTVLAALLVLALGSAPATDEQGGHRFVVRFTAAASAAERAAALDDSGLRIVDRLAGSDFVLAVSDDPARAARAGDSPAVADIRPPVAVRAFGAPNDPLYRLQWHLDQIQVPAAWDVSRGAGAIVAVLDTGVDRSLSDLAGTRFTAGFDFVGGDRTPEDDNGHGSHVIGTVAQTSNNSLGAAGVAPEATVMPLKVLDGAGAGDDWGVAQALHFAADNGAHVANLSLGAAQGSPVMEEAVNYATARGVTVVAASGNAGVGQVAYPAAYTATIAVGAVRYDRRIAPYSNTGARLDLVAPGGDASVDQNDDGYSDGVLQQTVRPDGPEPACFCFMVGTSMAAPHVSGVAALLVAAGTATPQQIRSALTSTALDLGTPGRDDTYGMGLVQARRALDAPVAPAEPAPAPSPETEPPGAEAPDPSREQPAPGSSRDIEDACPSGEVPAGRFSDVDGRNPHRAAIDCLAWLDVVAGAGAGRYLPGATVTREQMATFLARSVLAVAGSLPDSPPDAFTDDGDSIHHQRINQLAATGIVSGTVARAYNPTQPVTREQMATFLVRTLEYVLGDVVTARLDHFDDDDGSAHEARINAVATDGIAAGTGFRTFRPADAVRRDQMASFLARMLDYLTENGHPVEG